MIPHRFEAAYAFRDGLARVQQGAKAAYIDVHGDIVWRAP